MDIDNSINNSYCEDDRYQKQKQNCWNGDHLGDYTHNIMDMHSQKYNPEVPIEPNSADNTNSRLYKINDQLITMKNYLNKQVNAGKYRRPFMYRSNG